ANMSTSMGQSMGIPSSAILTRDLVHFRKPKDPKALHPWELSLVHRESMPDITSAGKSDMKTREFFEQVNALHATSLYEIGKTGNVGAIHITGVKDLNNMAHNSTMPHHLYLGLFPFPDGPLKKGMTYTIARLGGGRRSPGLKEQPTVRITIEEITPSLLRYSYGGRRFNPGIMKTIMKKMSGKKGPRISDVVTKFRGQTILDLKRKVVINRHAEHTRVKITVRQKGRRFSTTIQAFLRFTFNPEGEKNPIPEIFETDVVNQVFVE
ncbi:hypothetical protein KKF84_03550, partial [Myxococcota bacterium]|nr:hypothetical protein [Myxococcota bacterium]MBU1534367.1 hypothetical protein [Myxococcota bacterium]